MTHLEAELEQLKDSVMDMMVLAKKQLEKAGEALVNKDIELSEEIIHHERRMNAAELSVDRDCENIIALLNPVAIDLRFVLAMLKINSHLERMGDHAEGIAKYVLTLENDLNKDILKAIRFHEMFETAISMLEDIMEAFEVEDMKKARKVFKKDSSLNKINKQASGTISEFVKKDPNLTQQSLLLFSVIKKLERIGDLCKNMAEQLIFYTEAKILRHKKKKEVLK